MPLNSQRVRHWKHQEVDCEQECRRTEAKKCGGCKILFLTGWGDGEGGRGGEKGEEAMSRREERKKARGRECKLNGIVKLKERVCGAFVVGEGGGTGFIYIAYAFDAYK